MSLKIKALNPPQNVISTLNILENDLAFLKISQLRMLETFFNKKEVMGTGTQFPTFLHIPLFSLAFFVTIVVGTISHELGQKSL